MNNLKKCPLINPGFILKTHQITKRTTRTYNNLTTKLYKNKIIQKDAFKYFSSKDLDLEILYELKVLKYPKKEKKRDFLTLKHVKELNKHKRTCKNFYLINCLANVDTLRLAASQLGIDKKALKKINVAKLSRTILTYPLKLKENSLEFKIFLKALELSLDAVYTGPYRVFLKRDETPTKGKMIDWFEIEGTLKGELTLSYYLDIIRETKRITCPEFLKLLEVLSNDYKLPDPYESVFQKFICKEWDMVSRQPQYMSFHPFLKKTPGKVEGSGEEIELNLLPKNGYSSSKISLFFRRSDTTVTVDVGVKNSKTSTRECVEFLMLLKDKIKKDYGIDIEFNYKDFLSD